MTITEDIWIVETPVKEIQTPEIIEEIIPESTESQEVIDEKVNSLSENDINDLLKAITDWIWEDSNIEEIVSEPTIFEERPTELWEDDPVTDDEIEETLKLIEKLDNENDEFQVKITELNTLISEKDKQIQEEIQKQNAIEETWSQIVSHPIIWPFALQIAKWETPDIPDILQKQLQNEINSMPNIENTDQVSIKPVVETAADRIMWVKTW